MSHRPNNILLLDIIEACEKIETYTTGLTSKDFQESSMIKDAVERNIEIIGEACNKLSHDFKNEYSFVEWHKPIGMRNRLIHGYFSSDTILLWNTCTKIIPDFKKQITLLSNQI